MNKTDMWKAAKEAEERGVDPDTIMVTYTLEEYAQSHGDEVDTFDEDSLELRNLNYAIEEIEHMIEVVKTDVEVTQRLLDSSRNWAQKHELGQEIRDLERRIISLRGEQSKLITKRDALLKDFNQKYIR